MASVEVLGATGRAGCAAIARLEALGHGVAADGEVLLDLRPATADRRATWARALEAGRGVVAASLDPRDVEWARGQWAGAASDRGVALVPSAGTALVADLLAALASEAAGGGRELHTSHLVAERGGLLRSASPGLRAELAQLVGAPTTVVADGVRRDEPLGERRRLAWFARPVGPHHAAAVPAPEVVTIHAAEPGLELVTANLAVKTWQAELLQALGNLVRSESWAARIGARVQRPSRRPGPTDARWAIVAESLGPAGVARAWANGRDPQATAGDVAARTVDAVVGRGARGVPGPRDLFEPADLLDALAAEVGLRWSVVRPTP